MSETDDVVAIGRLQSAYADVVNRRAWQELHTLFLPDATVHIDTVTREPFTLTGPDAIGAFIGSAVQRFAFFEFVVLNSHVQIGEDGPDTARARMFMCEIRRDADTLEWSTAYGLYQDRYLGSERSWRFAARSYRSLTRTGGEVFAFPDLQW